MSTNFFALVNFGTTTCPEALCPLEEPLPPDSAGAVGAESAEPTVCLLEEEGGLRKKEKPSRKGNNSEGY